MGPRNEPAPIADSKAPAFDPLDPSFSSTPCIEMAYAIPRKRPRSIGDTAQKTEPYKSPRGAINDPARTRAITLKVLFPILLRSAPVLTMATTLKRPMSAS